MESDHTLEAGPPDARPDGRAAGLPPALSMIVASLDPSIDGVTVCDASLPDWPLVYANDAFVRMAGYPAHELLGRNCRLLQGGFHEANAPQRAVLRDALARGEPARVVLRNVRRDGTAFWNEVTLLPVSADGHPLVVGLQRDLTERIEQASASQREDAERLKLFDSVGDALFLLRDGRVAHANSAALGMLGAADAREILGQPVERFMPAGGPAQARTLHAQVAALTRMEPHEFECVRLDGTRFTADVTMSGSMLDGRPAMQLLMRDASARRFERELLRHERWALELIARDAPLPEVLTQLCVAVENRLPGARCSVVLLDEDGLRIRHGAAPSLPVQYVRAIDGQPVGPRAGSCGTAAYWRQQVIVADIADDPRWSDYRDLAMRHGLRACWSTPFLLADGRVGGTFAVYHDQPHRPSADELRILESTTRLAEIAVQQERLRQALASSEAQRGALLETVGAGIVTVGADGIVRGANPAAVEMLDLATRPLPGLDMRELLAHAVDGENRPLAPDPEGAWQRLRQPAGQRDLLVGIRTREGERRWLSVNACHLPPSAGVRDGDLVCAFNDVTQMKRAQEQLAIMATHDELTQLPNRAALARATRRALETAQRRGRPLGMLVLDLDGFKYVNDTLGHHAGDQLLCNVAARLSAVVRSPDLLARRGGDEFVVIAHEADEEGLSTLAMRVLEAFRHPFALQQQEVFVAASIGGSVFPRHGDTDEELFRHADAAMYRAKRAGRNRFVLHVVTESAPAVSRLVLETQLHHALPRGELLLHYQPRVATGSGVTTGVEALLRWRHPEMGLVSPTDFVPLAEENGLILSIGDWVLEQACRQAMAWRAEGLPELAMSVNVSPIQFGVAFFGGTVPRVLADTGLPARCLELELTESTMMNQLDAAAMQALQALRERGVRVVLDDFGTGYSSLSWLHRFPLDGLKVDRSFVQRLPDAKDARAITRAVLGMAQALGLRTVAEGVENAHQCDWLIEAGCMEFQGFLFARPMEADRLAGHLARSPA